MRRAVTQSRIVPVGREEDPAAMGISVGNAKVLQHRALRMAVMSCLVMQTSAKALKEAWRSALKSRMALYRPIMLSWRMSSRSAPTRK